MKKFTFILLLMFLVACQNKVTVSSSTTILISQAQGYFSGSVLTHGKAISYRARQAKLVQWDLAQVIPLSTGKGVLVPIVYTGSMLMQANFAGSSYFHLNNLTQLLVYKLPDSGYKAIVITSFPDSNFFKNPLATFHGIKFIEDWQGNSLGKYLFASDGSVKTYVPITKAVTGIVSTETCYTISGYNYSPDDPEDSYSWTEDAGCEANYMSIDVGGGSGGIAASTGNPILASGVAANATQVVILPPLSIIKSISSYFQCFTNVGGTDHNYKVTVAVDQPEPGQRTAWTLTPGGLSGSSQASNLVDVGHAFLILTETYGNTTITRNVGFYPSSAVTPHSPSAQGVLNDDDYHLYNISGSFSLTNAQFFSILNFISQGNSPGYLYNLNTNNCTTFVINAVSQAGIYLPMTIRAWQGGMGADPGDLGEDIRSGKTNGIAVNFAPGTDESHINAGQCN
jgi:hypothetical protein